MRATVIKHLARRYKSRAKAQAVCTRKNQKARKYAYVVEPDHVNPGWYRILGIPKGKIK